MGTLHVADGPRVLSRWGVVVCHGMLSSRSSSKHTGLCQALERQGLTALRFDFSGRGESEGRTEDLTYEGQVSDLEAACAALAYYAEPVALVGSSMGGAVAILGAGRRPSIRCIVGIAGVGRPWEVLERLLGGDEALSRWKRRGVAEVAGHQIGWGLGQSSAQTDVIGAARALGRPLLLLHGEHDDVVPLTQAREIATVAEAAELLVIEGGDHLLHRESDQALLEEKVCDFVISHLPL